MSEQAIDCKTMLLADVVERCVSEHEVGLTQSSADNYRRSIKRFSEHLGHPATIGDLTTPTVNGFLETMKGTMAEATRRGHRTALKRVINFAFEEGWLDEKPRKIRKILLSRPTPKAWRLSEVQKLISVASIEANWDAIALYSPDIDEAVELIDRRRREGRSYQQIADELTERGLRTPKEVGPWHRNVARRIHLRTCDPTRFSYRNRLHGVRKSVLVPALLSLGWDTGLRLGDMLSLSPAHVFRSGDKFVFRKQMNKTKFMATGSINDGTIELLNKLKMSGPERDTYFPKIGKTTLSRLMRHLQAISGVDGTTKFLRRGAASYAESVRYGGGSLLLGHRTRSITLDHYIDPEIAQPDTIDIPSALGESAKPTSSRDDLLAKLSTCDDATINKIAAMLNGGSN